MFGKAYNGHLTSGMEGTLIFLNSVLSGRVCLQIRYFTYWFGIVDRNCWR